jgi:fumarylpyruvate hydrolase
VDEELTMDFVFAPPPASSVAVYGDTRRFPVRRIFCVGRNYAAHAREMGRDPEREPPFFFMKPADAVVDSGAVVPYPAQTENLHHEIELVVALKKGGANVTPEGARDLVFGYGVGIDLTRRDLQLQARDAGRPWDWGKGFDFSAPCAPLHRIEETGWLQSGRIWLSVDGVTRQDADISQLIWNVAEVISAISQSMRVEAGDLIFTGTPEGVGALAPGAEVRGGIDRLGEIALTIGPPASR